MGNSVLFFEKYPFMGVELLDLLGGNYYLLSYYNDDCYKMLKKLDYPVLSYGSINFQEIIDSDKAIGFMLSNKHYLDQVVKIDRNNTKALFFYMSGEMDNLCQKQGIKMALPPYRTQEKLGNKLFLSEICQKLNIETNKTVSFDSSKFNPSEVYRRCRDNLGIPFVIQGALGVSGEDTSRVNSFGDFRKYTGRTHKQYRASKFLDNIIPVSVHICITKKKVLYEGPYIQIIGFKELAKNQFQFAGNDTNQQLLPKHMKEQVKLLSLKLASYAKELGYLGILGIDFLWDKSSSKVFVQEINSRLVGLTRLLTGVQKEQKTTPHLVRHINEFIPVKSSRWYVDKPLDLTKRNYSQVYISNNKDSTIEIKRCLFPGIYKIVKNRLIRTKNSLFLSDMEEDEILINFSAYKGCKLEADQVIAKIILKRTVLDKDKYTLTKDAINLISLIRSSVTN